jgi:molecular chaperone DnaJ
MSEREWLDKDFYKILGVGNTASQDEIKKKYRKLAREFHPDQNKNNPGAEAKFKEITAAYDILSKPEERKRYDAFRKMGAGGARFSGGTGGFEDIFSMFSGDGRQSRQGQQTHYTTFSGDPMAGGSFSSGGFSDLGDIFGTMFQGSNRQHGQQRQQSATQSARPVLLKTTLSFLESTKGKIVTIKLKNTDIKVRIPKGVQDGQTIKVPTKLYPNVQIKVSVRKNPYFSLDGLNVRLNLPVRFDELIFGKNVDVPTIYGDKITLKIPEYSKADSVLRVKNKGIEKNGKMGYMLVKLKVVTPSKMNTRAKQALKEFADTTKKEDPRGNIFL